MHSLKGKTYQTSFLRKNLVNHSYWILKEKNCRLFYNFWIICVWLVDYFTIIQRLILNDLPRFEFLSFCIYAFLEPFWPNKQGYTQPFPFYLWTTQKFNVFVTYRYIRFYDLEDNAKATEKVIPSWTSGMTIKIRNIQIHSPDTNIQATPKEKACQKKFYILCEIRVCCGETKLNPILASNDNVFHLRLVQITFSFLLWYAGECDQTSS